MSDDESLQPVGTEFERIEEPSLGSTDCHRHRARWRVVAHVKVLPLGPGGPMRLTEKVELIEREPLNETAILDNAGHWRWEAL